MVSRAQLDPMSMRPIRASEYDKLTELGFFEGEHLELIHGVIVSMSPQGAPHIATINRLNMILAPLLAGRAVVQVQGPLALGHSRPEPDLSILEPGDRDDALPSSALIVIEVAETSLDYDRNVKAPLYASHGVPEYWLVNLEAKAVEVHTGPTDTGYKQTVRFCPGESISMRAFDDVEIAVSDFLR